MYMGVLMLVLWYTLLVMTSIRPDFALYWKFYFLAPVQWLFPHIQIQQTKSSFQSALWTPMGEKLMMHLSATYFHLIWQNLIPELCRYIFGWLEATLFCAVHGHTNYLRIFAITTWQCSQSLYWRCSGASSGCSSELKMNGTRLPGLVFNSQKFKEKKRNC